MSQKSKFSSYRLLSLLKCFESFHFQELVFDFVMDAISRVRLGQCFCYYCLLTNGATFVSSRHDLAIFTLISLIIFAIRKFAFMLRTFLCMTIL